jgi:UDP-N-acetylmuramoyl-tripeptide--D-alanyl-D-alanine ligase
MLELGENTLNLHAQTGAHAAKRGVNLVIGCGKLSASTVEGAKNAGAETRFFADKADLIAALPELIRDGDSVLVKASHSMAFEHVVAALEKL